MEGREAEAQIVRLHVFLPLVTVYLALLDDVPHLISLRALCHSKLLLFFYSRDFVKIGPLMKAALEISFKNCEVRLLDETLLKGCTSLCGCTAANWYEVRELRILTQANALPVQCDAKDPRSCKI